MQEPVSAMSQILSFWWVIPVVLALVGYKYVFRLLGIVIVPEDSVGIVNKTFVLFGANKTLPDGRIVALNGEAGYQADCLAPGLYFWYWPWQYDISMQKFITVGQDQLGIVDAKDGNPIPAGRVLARKVDCDSFQNARSFLANGGERGPQITIVPPGVYRINTSLFNIRFTDAASIPENRVGIVTTHEGQPLLTGEIAGREIDGHNMYQDGQTFIENGGMKGLQEQVMLAGTYYLNPNLVSIQLVDMTEVPIGYVGVVVSYVGGVGTDTSGATFKHGNIVARGMKGVWADPLGPGKYPINPNTHKVELVPTTNIVLNWATAKTESHKLDANLSTITVRSGDGFTFNLDVSQIIHVAADAASKVIARFGNMHNLVTQVLEPLIGNYFRNSAQSSDVIEFLQNRSERQRDAKAHISKVLEEYDVSAVDALIGDIVPPADLMETLTDRKIAQQQQVTYEIQKDAEVTRQELEKARANADTQASVVQAERGVQIAELTAQSTVKTAKGEADSKVLNADADAKVLRVTGEAEGVKILAIGNAEAEVIRNKVVSMGSDNYATLLLMEQISDGNVKIVPEVMVGGGNGGTGSVGDALLGIITSKMLTNQEPRTITEINQKPSGTAIIE